MEFKKLNFKKPSSIIKIAIIIVILGLICLIIAFLPFGYFSRNVTNNINSTLIGFGTGLILTAITISFIQYFLDQQKFKIKEEIERKQERDNLIKLDRIMEIFITKYIIYFNCVTIPISKRFNNNELQLNLDFEFKDIKDLFLPSLYLFNDFSKSSIELFYEYEIRLRNLMIDIVGKNNLKYHEEILNIFTKFITFSLNFDFSDSIIYSAKNRKSNKTIINSIAKSDKKYLEEARNYKHSDSIHPFIFLYDLLKEEGKLILEYQNEIEKIKKSQEV